MACPSTSAQSRNCTSATPFGLSGRSLGISTYVKPEMGQDASPGASGHGDAHVLRKHDAGGRCRGRLDRWPDEDPLPVAEQGCGELQTNRVSELHVGNRARGLLGNLATPSLPFPPSPVGQLTLLPTPTRFFHSGDTFER